MINLPLLFETKLKKNAKLHSGVRTALDNFEPWLEQSGMPFFPGFTDHSPRHINEVLNTAAAIISDDSHALLSPEDVAALTLAVLLHDCGMHLTQDGFRNLIANYPPKLINGFEDKPWPDLWSDFLGEAQRFGEDRLIAIFGDSEPVHVDSIDINNLSERDLLLAGEFIRRHHARLAHEIAIYGTPSKDANKLSLKDIDLDLQDIAGLIARSHNLSIRGTFSYITERYSRLAEYREIKIPYLMAVVRIADYIQVQSERALKSLLSVKELRSPISRQEWKNHFAVKNVSTRHEDPEALYVHADPIDVKTYLRLDSLFKDIQRELDLSWAAIGEIYGRYGDLKKLGLTIRRLRSNIDDLKKFSRTVQYIPTRAGFGTSGPDLLKLLVGPLYDYEYSVGIRELLQNSADACKELIDIQNKGQKRETNDPEVKLEISETENGDGWITVSDSGVGMTLETVQTYFLTAGASFRNSDAWKKLHLDESGNSRVLRGGRFGVGALAAFLLGDEIHVTTRHFNRSETEGIEFKAKIDDPIIELRRCTAPRGTTIRIWVNNADVLKKLRPHIDDVEREGQHIEIEHWRQVDWYKQKSPKIHCNWSGNVKIFYYDDSSKVRVSASYIRKDDFSPSPNESNNEDWKPLRDPGPFRAVYWRYPKANSEPKPTDDTVTANNSNEKIGGDSDSEGDSDGEKLFYKVVLPREAIVNGIYVETIFSYRSNSLLKIQKLIKARHPFQSTGPAYQ